MTGTEHPSGAPGPQTALHRGGRPGLAQPGLAGDLVGRSGIDGRDSGLLTGRLVGLMAGWIVLSLAASLLTLSRRARPWLGAAIDLASGLAFIGETGLGSSPLWWTPLIAGTTAGLAYGFVGGLSFAGIGALAWMLGSCWRQFRAAGPAHGWAAVAGLSLGALVVGGVTRSCMPGCGRRGSHPPGVSQGRRRRCALPLAGQLDDSLSGLSCRSWCWTWECRSWRARRAGPVRRRCSWTRVRRGSLPDTVVHHRTGPGAAG
jgi:hypothetical protein